MIQLVIPEREFWDTGKSEFNMIKGTTIQVEHSLVSVSKWESKWKKSFFNKRDKTTEEIIDYVRCMTITQNVRPEVYSILTNDNMNTISEYIAESMTATFFNDESKPTAKEIITSEVIYYWMITYNIPFSCEKWHLSRLLALIKVCSKKNDKPKKMSRAEIINRNRELNNKRKQQYNTKG